MLSGQGRNARRSHGGSRRAVTGRTLPQVLALAGRQFAAGARGHCRAAPQALDVDSHGAHRDRTVEMPIIGEMLHAQIEPPRRAEIRELFGDHPRGLAADRGHGAVGNTAAVRPVAGSAIPVQLPARGRPRSGGVYGGAGRKGNGGGKKKSIRREADHGCPPRERCVACIVAALRSVASAVPPTCVIYLFNRIPGPANMRGPGDWAPASANRGGSKIMSATTAVSYNDKVVRQFALMTVVWGVVGMLVGVVIAAQLLFPALNFDLPWLTFSRLRPLHTNAVIFAFGGSAIFATSYYIVQRTCHVRLFSDGLAAFTFWGWQLVIVLAAVSLPMGWTSGKEYAELEWPIDLLIAVVWVAYGVVFLGTLAKRRVEHIYVANWFFAAFIITVAVLHIVNSAAVPVTATKSYSAYAGVVDAMVQWWYGHNAVGFFLTAAFLGMMYYFVPKQAGRPIYSYRLSIVHFWSLISIYMWAGPHHLHYTTLPDWAQTLGMVFSLMLIAPSWGGMINGIMTLSGAWHKLRTDPILKFLIVSLSFYGMSTFEGPMMSIKTVNALSHYTDWTIGHVHSGALGWVAMVSVGSLYMLIPRLYGRTEMWSTRLIDLHFWTTTIGIVLYTVSMWIAGVMQGLMWRATNADGTLTYTFVEALKATYPYYAIRLVGGALVLFGMFIMVYNVVKTIGAGRPMPVAIPSPQPAHA